MYKMAISIAEQYPGKTAGTNTDYPYGQARNVTAPGDGTGTPFEQALVNDDQGFKQALLKAAALIPSGDPDTAVASQYLQAIQKLISDATATKVKAWVRFGYIGTAIQIFASKGVSGVTRISAGKYRVTFTTPIPSAAYAAMGNAQQGSNAGSNFANVLVPMAYANGYVDVWTVDNSQDDFYDTSNATVTIVT